MAVEMRCPQCQSAWLIDESTSEGEFTCPTCLHRIDPVAGAATKADPPPAVEPVSTGEEIVCPRCNLHFYPRGRKPAPAAERRYTVLVVEDQEYFRQIAADALEAEYHVKTAAGGREAREMLAQGGIDLLILDLTLDGEEQGGSLLRDLVPKPCPILIFTAQDESELYGERWDELTRLGADDLVMKGMQVSESLRRKVRVLLGQPADEEEPIG